ncbi:microfibril-associated glycoprotein 4-like [Mercenaria mercenaria]|uniref:microfibril-associated glycoprotein 4-like n=1 Tax=Mercenaria mercenaria TaxID=6596 RepID=UPI00234E4214|nr:microfibril-associated glycoprotein 4-like [Mercenaria mercenaria]
MDENVGLNIKLNVAVSSVLDDIEGETQEAEIGAEIGVKIEAETFSSVGDTNGLTYNNGRAFSTYDHEIYGCALNDRGGWWYYSCTLANLNGEYFTPGSSHGEPGMTFRYFKGTESLKTSRIIFRRV